MIQSSAPENSHSATTTQRAGTSLRLRFFLAFAFLGLFLPIGVVYYEHHAGWLPIRLVIALWPASVILLPDPAGVTAIFLNALSLALNALIYGLVGLGIGALIGLARARK